VKSTRSRRLLALIAAIISVTLFLVARSRWAPSPKPVVVSVETTGATGPKTPAGELDFQAAAGASVASDERADALVTKLNALASIKERCREISPEESSELKRLLEQPLRLRGSYHEVMLDKFGVMPSVYKFAAGVRCACQLSPVSAKRTAETLLALSAHLSTANTNALYMAHADIAKEAADCLMKSEPAVSIATSLPNLVHADEHLKLLHILMAEEMAHSHAPFYDANIALQAFGKMLDTIRSGGALPPGPRDPGLWHLLRSGEVNQSDYSVDRALMYGSLAEDAYQEARKAARKTAEARLRIAKGAPPKESSLQRSGDGRRADPGHGESQ
jgi:hypothetical protein